MSWIDVAFITWLITMGYIFIIPGAIALVRGPPKSFCVLCSNDGSVIVGGRGVMCPKCYPKEKA